MNDLKVSIIIPVYNGLNYLGEAIDSALKQTYRNIEILVIDDGSTDGNVKEFVRLLSSEIIYLKKTNGGVASALNLGIDNMTGDFFSWLSHDDLYLPTKIASQVEMYVRNGNSRGIIYSGYIEKYQKSNIYRKVEMQGVPPRDFKLWLIEKTNLNGCTLLIPRNAFELVGMFDENLRAVQDFDMWIRMSKEFEFIYQNEFNTILRVHDEQDSIKLKEVVLAEVNAILTTSILNLSLVELSGGARVDQTINRLLISLEERGFVEARMELMKIFELREGPRLLFCESLLNRLFRFLKRKAKRFYGML